MNKKLLIGLMVIGVWFVIIAGFGFYYLVMSESKHKQEEHNKIETSVAKVENKIPQPENIETLEENKPEVKDPEKPKINPVVLGSDKVLAFKTKDGESEKPKEAVNSTANPEKENSAIKTKPEEVGGVSVRGHLLNKKTNIAIEGAFVDFYTSEAIFIKRVITDKNGSFEASHIKGENIQLRISKERFVSLTLKNYSSEQLSEHLLLKLDPGNKISGKVKDKATQAVLGGVLIEVYRGLSLIKKSDLTDPGGNFIVDAMPSGALELIFSKSGYSVATQKVTIESEDISGVQIALDKSSTLLIEVNTMGGYVEIPKLRVYLDGSKDPLSYERSILTEDANKNIFRISGVERPYSRIRVHAEGFTYPAEKQISIIAGQETKVVFEVERGLTVNGFVHNVEGSPLKGVSFQIFEVFGAGRASSDDILKGKVISDEKGKISVTGITKGNIEVVLISTIYKRFQKKFIIAEDNNPEIDIQLEVESFFMGTVKSQSGEVINVAEVRMTPIKENGSFDPMRDRPVFNGNTNDGKIKISGVVSGLYRLSITANGYSAFINERYEVKPNQVSDQFVMEKGISVSGEVKTDTGILLPNCEILFTANTKETNVKFKSTTDANGFFALQGLNEGASYRLQAQARGYKLYDKEILTASGVNFYSIVLQKKMMFGGVVLDNNSQLPIQNFQVKVFSKLEQSLLDDSSESFNSGNGQFSIPVNADVFNLEIKATGYATYLLKDVKLTDPIQNHYLFKAGSINFKVKCVKDPAVMKQIQISTIKEVDTDQNKKNIRTDSNGNAIVQNLKPGEYYIRISGVTGYANYDTSVIVREDVEVNKNIVLVPGFTLRGRLIASDTNIPITVGEVHLDSDRYTKPIIKTTVDNDGFFEFKNVNVGQHQITVLYGPIVSTKFSSSLLVQIEVPDVVNNSKGVYQIEDIRIK